jgi:flagellar biogenesis protein FliO
VGGDLVGDQAVAHVFGVGQSQVLLGVTKQSITVPYQPAITAPMALLMMRKT